MAVSLTSFQDPQALTLCISKVNKQPNGQSTLSYLDGTVASCQPPNGEMSFRPAGTAGAYEICDISGNVATFNPAGTRYTKAFVVVTA